MNAYVALGANLGDTFQTLQKAIMSISSLPQTQVVKQSSFYKTAPVDSSGPDYLNAVIAVCTTIKPIAFLQELLSIEKQFGRVRPSGIINAPRTLDLDLLLYEDLTLVTPTLTLPHPRMHERAFVLVPLLEIAPQIDIPGKGKAAQFLSRVNNQSIELYRSE